MQHPQQMHRRGVRRVLRQHLLIHLRGSTQLPRLMHLDGRGQQILHDGTTLDSRPKDIMITIASKVLFAYSAVFAQRGRIATTACARG